MHENDPILGWRNKEGAYKVPPYYPDEATIKITFLKTGLRKTYEQQNNTRDDRPKIIFVGGSFTQGWAISDNETFPWKVQENFPSFEVLNFGTGGYGTYQSLMTLEQIMPFTEDPILIVYGFNQFHEMRNVAPADWLAALSFYSHRGHVFVPYVTLDWDGNLQRHQPERYSSWPFREKVVIITKAENLAARLTTFWRKTQARPVTQKLLLQMQNLSFKNHAKFLVVILCCEEDEKTSYVRFAERNDILIVDCAYPINEEMKVKGEGHPNGKMNSKWAACITESIRNHGLTNRRA